ncbi:LAO/AO transport system kinase [Cnuella takakiae]|uniref:LAO/AO transport system kinase n=1 Tax=Cnuella takakiae TaxID=1302690 RepID=A0A1M5GTH2_9BACT|nr:methylmalonyl Co-A mutase-associated GTPase MeaB [Cnuella takakiae]OLY90895.1 transporter [Cnuella takakiae]SHG06973.1 LAO/AO transport system kinase [Cnuella takakiae]
MLPISLLPQIEQGDFRSLARAITLVENGFPGYEDLLAALTRRSGVKIIGITGPPGAGKSTLTDGIIRYLLGEGSKVAVLCVDPSSPFNLGAVLGDRIRMSEWYTHPKVFIRSLATRGAMGGLHPKIIEISELVKSAGFDYILVETVGVGQSEVEIAGLADTTAVVLVPEAGDEVQTMKAGLMEIADVFVVNKADRPGADRFVRHLQQMLAPAFQRHQRQLPILKTVAATGEGLPELVKVLQHTAEADNGSERHLWLLAEKAWHLVQQARMRNLPRETVLAQLKKAVAKPDFNLYRFAQSLTA